MKSCSSAVGMFLRLSPCLSASTGVGPAGGFRVLRVLYVAILFLRGRYVFHPDRLRQIREHLLPSVYRIGGPGVELNQVLHSTIKARVNADMWLLDKGFRQQERRLAIAGTLLVIT